MRQPEELLKMYYDRMCDGENITVEIVYKELTNSEWFSFSMCQIDRENDPDEMVHLMSHVYLAQDIVLDDFFGVCPCSKDRMQCLKDVLKLNENHLRLYNHSKSRIRENLGEEIGFRLPGWTIPEGRDRRDDVKLILAAKARVEK